MPHMRRPHALRLGRPNVDLWVGSSTLLILLVYVVVYGVVRLHGFVLGHLNAGYVIIIVPIWLIDGMRSLLDMALAKDYKLAREDLSKVTVVIACKDGEDVIGQTLEDLKQRFSPGQIIVASNGSSDRTCDIVRTHGAVCIEIKQPIGKVRAINAVLRYVTTPYVLLLDDDTLIGRARIPTGLLEQGYAGVAFRLHIKTSTWLSFLQAHEYRKSSDIGKRRHNKGGAVQNISGAVGLFTRQELVRQVRHHSGEFSGEDLQRTMLLHMADDPDHQGVVLADSIVLTEPPTTVWLLYKQRVFGWFPGQYANIRNYFRVMLHRRVPFGLREDAFYNVFLVIFMDVIRILALPIIVFYPWYFVVMYVVYCGLETVAYFKNRRAEPYWVVLAYPFYGLFGLATRFGAFAVFLYRRVVAKLCRMSFLDDYRRAPYGAKVAGFGCVLVILSSVLALNIIFNYSRIFTNVDWGKLTRRL